MGMLPLKGSDVSCCFRHSSASASQYSISRLAVAAFRRQMVANVAKFSVGFMGHPALRRRNLPCCGSVTNVMPCHKFFVITLTGQILDLNNSALWCLRAEAGMALRRNGGR